MFLRRGTVILRILFVIYIFIFHVNGNGGGGGIDGGQSVGAQFKNQLNSLLGAIGETHPHYVRCLKPNDENVRSNFNVRRIASQLANGGD